MNDRELRVGVDDCSAVLQINDMPKLLPPGPIRFYSSLCWMGIGRITLTPADEE
jgi:hypothetical protein